MNLRRSRRAKVAASEFVRRVISGQTSGAATSRTVGKEKQSPKAKLKRSSSRSPSRASGSTPTPHAASRGSTPSRSPARSQEVKSKSPARGVEHGRSKSPARGTKEKKPSSGRESSPKRSVAANQTSGKAKVKSSSLCKNKETASKPLEEVSKVKHKVASKKSGKQGKQLESGSNIVKKKKENAIKSCKSNSKETSADKGGCGKVSSKDLTSSGSAFTKIKNKSSKSNTSTGASRAGTSPKSEKLAFSSLNNPPSLVDHPGIRPISTAMESRQQCTNKSNDEASNMATTSGEMARLFQKSEGNSSKVSKEGSNLEDCAVLMSSSEKILRHPAEHLTAEQFFPLVGLVKKSDLPQVDPSRNKLHREAGGKLRRVIKPRIVPEMIYRQFAISRGCFISDMWSDSDSDECSGRESPRISAPGHILQSEHCKKKHLSPKIHDRYRQVCTKIPLIKIEKVEGEGSPTNSPRAREICFDPSSSEALESPSGSLTKGNSFKENEIPFEAPLRLPMEDAEMAPGMALLSKSLKSGKKKEWLKPTKRPRLLPESSKSTKTPTEISTPSKSKNGSSKAASKKNDTKKKETNKKENTPTKHAKKEVKPSQPRLYPPPKPCIPDINQPAPSRRSTRAGAANRKQWWHLLRAAPDEYVKDPGWEEELVKAKRRRDARNEKVESRVTEGIEDSEEEIDESDQQADERSSEGVPTPTKASPLKSPIKSKNKKGKKKISDSDLEVPCTTNVSSADICDSLDPADKGQKSKKKDWALAKRVLEEAKVVKGTKEEFKDTGGDTEESQNSSKGVKRNSDADTDGVFKKPKVDLTDSGSSVKKKRVRKRPGQTETSETALMVIGPQGRPFVWERKQFLNDKTKEALDQLACAKRKREGYMEFSLSGSHIYKVKRESDESRPFNASLNYYQGHECEVPHMCSICWINDHMYCRNMRRTARDLPPSGGCIHYIPCEHFRHRRDYTRVSPGILERRTTYHMREIQTDRRSFSVCRGVSGTSPITSPSGSTTPDKDKKLPTCEADLICEETLQESDSEPSSPERPAGTEMLQVHLRVRAAQIEQSLGHQGIVHSEKSSTSCDSEKQHLDVPYVCVTLDDQEEDQIDVPVCEYACEVTIGGSEDESDDDAVHVSVPVPDPPLVDSDFWEEWNKTCNNNANGLQIKLEPKSEEELKALYSKKSGTSKEFEGSSDSDNESQDAKQKEGTENANKMFAKDTFKIGAVKNACLKAKQIRPFMTVQTQKSNSSYKVSYSYIDSRLKQSKVVQARTVVPPVGVPEKAFTVKHGQDIDLSKYYAKLKQCRSSQTKSDGGSEELPPGHEDSNDSHFVMDCASSDSESVSGNDSAMTSPACTPVPTATVQSLERSSSPLTVAGPTIGPTTNLQPTSETIVEADDTVTCIPEVQPSCHVTQTPVECVTQADSGSDSVGISTPLADSSNFPMLQATTLPLLDHANSEISASSASIEYPSEASSDSNISSSLCAMQVVNWSTVPITPSNVPYIVSAAVTSPSDGETPLTTVLANRSVPVLSHSCVSTMSTNSIALPQNSHSIAADTCPVSMLNNHPFGTVDGKSTVSFLSQSNSFVPILNSSETLPSSSSCIVASTLDQSSIVAASESTSDYPIVTEFEDGGTSLSTVNIPLASLDQPSTNQASFAVPSFQNLHIIPKTRPIQTQSAPQQPAPLTNLPCVPTAHSSKDDHHRKSPALALAPIKIQSTQAELPSELQNQSTPSRDGSQVLTFTTKEIRERRPELLAYIKKAGLAQVIAEKLTMEKQSIDLMLANTVEHSERLQEILSEKQEAVSSMQSQITSLKYQLEQFIEPLQENQTLVSRLHVQRIGHERKLQLVSDRLNVLTASMAALDEHEAQEVMQSPFDIAEIELPLDAS